jgi:hypothetical protein
MFQLSGTDGKGWALRTYSGQISTLELKNGTQHLGLAGGPFKYDSKSHPQNGSILFICL